MSRTTFRTSTDGKYRIEELVDREMFKSGVDVLRASIAYALLVYPDANDLPDVSEAGDPLTYNIGSIDGDNMLARAIRSAYEIESSVDVSELLIKLGEAGLSRLHEAILEEELLTPYDLI